MDTSSQASQPVRKSERLILSTEQWRFAVEQGTQFEIHGKRFLAFPFILAGNLTGNGINDLERIEPSVIGEEGMRKIFGLPAPPPPDQRIELLNKHSVSVTDKDTGKEYFFFPYWLEKGADGKLVQHALGKLPKELVAAIDQMCNTISVPKSEDVQKYPATKA